ncbi:MAG TPA: DUF3574 domain-containing protein [Gemmatimonadales bacterium]|nr:DUF3574 domain-containing protein [Gemmatimonadales bacterium]
MRAARCAFLLIATVLGCASAIHPIGGGAQSVVTERLYFGRKIGDSLGVTDSAWSVFLKDVVSARFPTGFTFWAAEGEWRGSSGRAQREPSMVLEIVHPSQSAAADSAITAIITEYKRRFRQESVLRVITSARASF